MTIKIFNIHIKYIKQKIRESKIFKLIGQIYLKFEAALSDKYKIWFTVRKKNENIIHVAMIIR